MTDQLSFEGGVFKVIQGGRTVMGSDRRHVTLLPSANDFGTIAAPQNIVLNYPDVTKGWLYNWRARSVRNPGLPGYSLGEIGDGYIAAYAQEWSDTAVLAAAPAGCNFFAARVRISRTGAPSNTWIGNTILVKPPTGEWIPFSGSVLLEEMLGLCRAFSLYIDGSGNLVRHMQQSVSVGPAYTGNNVIGWAAGHSNASLGYLGATGAPAADGNQHDGGEWTYDGTVTTGPVGLPIFTDPATMHTNYTYSVNDPFTPSWGGYCRRISGDARETIPAGLTDGSGNIVVGGAAASVTDHTNYASTYSIDIAGKFGRAA